MTTENQIVNIDCMEYMCGIETGGAFDLTLTDIPYNVINRESNGLRNLDKMSADKQTFELCEFLDEVFRLTKSIIIIFCAKEQVSYIHGFFAEKQKQGVGTVRQLIWEKTNPSPMNGQYVYLSGIENAVWFKKRGGTFNAHCKNTVFRFPNGRNKIHPTEKNIELIKELIRDNSNPGDIVFDPCAGSGCHLIAASQLGRRYIGCEIDSEWCSIAVDRLKNT